MHVNQLLKMAENPLKADMDNAIASINTKEEKVDVIEEPQPSLVSEDALAQVSDAILDLYKPELDKQHERVKEVLRNQGVLMDSTQNEVVQLRECQMLNDIQRTFDDIKVYQKKLLNMKKNMKSIQERSEKARVRAQKLMIQKQKEELHIAHEKEKQRKYEIDLTAKPAQEYLEESLGSSASADS